MSYNNRLTIKINEKILTLDMFLIKIMNFSRKRHMYVHVLYLTMGGIYRVIVGHVALCGYILKAKQSGNNKKQPQGDMKKQTHNVNKHIEIVKKRT